MPRTATSIIKGIAAAAVLLGVYFAVLTLVSGSRFAASQFGEFWYFIVALAAGFGTQIGLYAYLKAMIHGAAAGKIVATTGATSTAAMISCCTHYLVNILPILGATGIAAFTAAYHVRLFWVGIAFNLAGIAFIGQKIIKAKNMRP